MHLTFPSRNESFTREELRCLSAALGFQEEIFTKHVPLTSKNHTVVETKVIHELIERKAFNNDLHRTYNLHDGVYNAAVLQKALHCLSNRIISFPDLKDIRIAFQLYECQDLSGLETNPRVILRTLKMCGRVISPRKLIDHVKYIARTIPDKLMLYEFMELIPLCEKGNEVKKEMESQTAMQNFSTFTEVTGFDEILIQQDKKEFNYLDDIYEKSFFRPTFITKPTWGMITEDALNKDWKNYVSSHRQIAVGLDATLGRSNKKVVRARNGTAGSREMKFLDVSILNDRRQRPEMTTVSREVEVEDGKHVEILHSSDTNNINYDNTNETSCDVVVIPPSSPSFPHSSPSLISGADRQQCWSDPPKYLSKKSKMTDEKVLVTKQALHDTRMKIVDLLWDLEMKDELSKRNSMEQKPHIRHEQLSEEKRDKVTARSSQQCEEEKEPSALQVLSSTSPQLDSTASDIYGFLHSRIKERDSLLGRCSTPSNKKSTRQNKMTRVSRTDYGRSRQSRNTVRAESAGKFLSAP